MRKIDSVDYFLTTSHRYDEDGRIISKTEKLLFEIPKKTVYSYNSDKQKIKEVIYFEGYMAEIITTYGDDKLPEYKTVTHYDYPRKMTSYYTSFYDYQIQNGNYTVENKDYQGESKEVYSTETKVYDSNLRLLNHTMEYNGQIIASNWKYETTKNGSVKVKTEKDWNGSIFETTEVFNKEGKPLSKTKTNGENNVISSVKYKYADDKTVVTTQMYQGKRYKEKGAWSEETKNKDGLIISGEYKSGSGGVSKLRSEYEYDAHGNWIVQRNYRLSDKYYQPENSTIIIRRIEYYK